MNKQGRVSLEKAEALIREAASIIEDVRNEEQEKFDNLPEGLQYSEKGQRFEEIVSVLEDVESALEEACDSIQEAIE